MCSIWNNLSGYICILKGWRNKYLSLEHWIFDHTDISPDLRQPFISVHNIFEIQLIWTLEICPLLWLVRGWDIPYRKTLWLYKTIDSFVRFASFCNPIRIIPPARVYACVSMYTYRYKCKEMESGSSSQQQQQPQQQQLFVLFANRKTYSSNPLSHLSALCSLVLSGFNHYTWKMFITMLYNLHFHQTICV